jgi:hypothetical protein
MKPIQTLYTVLIAASTLAACNQLPTPSTTETKLLPKPCAPGIASNTTQNRVVQTPPCNDGGSGGGGVIVPPKPIITNSDVIATRFWVAINDQNANPWNTLTGKAMTWRQLDIKDELTLVGSDASSANATDGTTNPYAGDTSIKEQLPMLCLNVDGSPVPAGITTNFYQGWVEGKLQLTVPMTGTLLNSQDTADQICATAFGRGWRMAEFHDGKSNGVAGGWSYYGYGNLALVSPQLQVLNEQDRNLVSAFDASSGSVTFAAQPSKLAVDDFIISEPTANAPYGIPPRKVVSINQVGKSFVAETIEAGLEDVVLDGQVDTKTDLSTVPVVSEEDETGVTDSVNPQTRRIIKLFGIDKTFDKILYDADGNPQTINDQVKLTGNFQAEVDAFINLRIRWFKVQYFDAGLQLDEKASAKLVGEATVNLNSEILLLNRTYRPIVFFIGVVPVVLVPNLKIYLGSSGKIHGKVKFEVSQSYFNKQGVKWERGIGWGSINEVQSNFNFLTPEVEASTDGNYIPRGYVGLKGSLSLYGIYNIYAYPKVFAELEGWIKYPPLSYSYCLYAGLSLSVHGEGRIFGTSFGVFDKDFGDVLRKQLKCAQSNPINQNPGRFWVSINDRNANPWNTTTGKAMTWVRLQTLSGNVVQVGSDQACDLAGGIVPGGEGTACPGTNPYSGDATITKALPIACLKFTGQAIPANVPNNWYAGDVKLTPAVVGLTMTSQAVANGICAQNFGSGWRMAEFHDAGGWNFYASGTF